MIRNRTFYVPRIYGPALHRYPCGLRYCPICPPPDLSAVPWMSVTLVPYVPPPRDRCQPRLKWTAPEHKGGDTDGPSASWGMIVRAYEDGGGSHG